MSRRETCKTVAAVVMALVMTAVVYSADAGMADSRADFYVATEFQPFSLPRLLHFSKEKNR